VGEGIRESVELIAEFFQKHAHLNFSFALVEMEIFHFPESLTYGYIVHPRVLTQTVEIERAVIRIEEGTWNAEMAPESDNNLYSRRRKISEEVFFEELENRPAGEELRSFFSKLSQVGLTLQPGQYSINVKYIHGDREFNLGTFKTNGLFQNYNIAYITQQIGYPEIGEEYLEKLAPLFQDGSVYEPTSRFQWTIKKKDNQYFSVEEILAVQEKWLNIIQRTITRIDEISLL
jgi:hypothetical protein